MKRRIKLAMLAVLIAVPTTSINSTEKAHANSFDSPTFSALPFGTNLLAVTTTGDSAGFNINDIRLNELYALNEYTVIADIENLRKTLEALGLGSTNELNILFEKKLDYIKTINELKKSAALLNNDIGLLKTSNADTIDTVGYYLDRYNSLEQQYEVARKTLDDSLKAAQHVDLAVILDKGFSHMAIYTGTLEKYILTVIPKYETLLKFESNVVKPKQIIQSSVANPFKVTVNTNSVGSTTSDTMNITFSEFSTTTNFSADPATAEAEMKQFRKQYENISLFMNTQMSADEKKIFESHKLPSGKTVGALLNEVKTNIEAADKVTSSIVAMETATFKSDAAFSTAVKNINTAYNKLTSVGKALVPLYNEKVTKKVADGKNSGYMAVDEVTTAIKNLKPAATVEYRTALGKVEELVNNLDSAQYTKFVIDKATYATQLSNLVKAKEVEVLIDAINPAPTVKKITDARAAYKALTSAQQKVVLKTTYTALQTWEKDSKDSTKVNTTISKIKIENKKTFATNVEKAQKSYDALGTSVKKELVESKSRLQLMTALSKLTGQYYALKLSAKDDYRTGVDSLKKVLDNNKVSLTTLTPAATHSTASADTAALENLYDKLVVLVNPKATEIQHAKNVEAIIVSADSAVVGPAKITGILDARTAYNNLTKNEQKIVNNLKKLKSLETTIKTPSKVLTAVMAVNPLASNFESKAKSAIKSYDKLTTVQKNYYNDDIKKQIADFKLMLEFMTQMKALKISNATYRDDITAAQKRAATLKTQFTSSKTPALLEVVSSYETTLDSLSKGITKSDVVVALIANLPSKFGQDFINGIAEIETEYAKLSKDGKKLVTNYQAFQSLNKDGTTAIKVINLINNSYIVNVDVANSNYEKAMTAAITAYNKLTPTQRLYVYNYDSRIKPYLNVYELVVLVNKLNPSSKTYWEEVATVRARYDALTEKEKAYAAPLLSKIEGGETGLTEVQNVMNLIDIAVPEAENYVEKLKAARAAYDRLATLNAAYQKLVLNYKTLQEREKAIAPVTSSIHEIEELEILYNRPFNDAVEFVKKYQSAMKAYEKIPFESRQLVSNRDKLLLVIYPVASTMEAILNIKESSTTFAADVAKARTMYNALSANDKKLVTNYNTLTSFEVTVTGGNKVDELIRTISTKSSQAYMQAIKDARAAYDQLSTSEKKAVSLYKELQAYEKAVQNVLTAIDLIDALQYSSNLVTAYDKATSALDKLTSEQRAMVSNISKLAAVAPAIEVYKMIANLKPGSDSYSGTVQAAYAAYNRLSNLEKQYVTNFAQLQEAKNNIDTLSTVIAKISEITPGSRNYATQVQEALALYNSLPASIKKLVTNYQVLTNSKAELDAVEKVRSLISEIDINSVTFATKVVAARTAYDKLSTNQKRLVSNYFMLEEYESQLGTMF